MQTGRYPMTELTAGDVGEQKAIVKHGLVYVVTEDFALIALNKNTGKVKWRTPAQTINVITDYVNDTYWWAFKVRVKNKRIAITYDAPERKTLYVSTKTGKQIGK